MFEGSWDPIKVDLFNRDKNMNYELQKSRDAKAYEEIPIIGACIDIGGFQGRIREFMDDDQPYLSIDPMLDVFNGIEMQSNLISSYPCLLKKVNFLCGYGEYLPIMSESFQTVHMRSCIDHMFLPEIAILEAFRVLDKGGQIIVGSYVEGGKSGKKQNYIKSIIKQTLEAMKVERFIDHHMWHPTYTELCELLKSCGFSIDKTYWQDGFNDTVCYVRGLKK